MASAGCHTLLTGPPGCGKTTVVQRLVERLQGVSLRGFFTREWRAGGRRVGFEAVGLRGTRALLAHTDTRSPWRVGRYGVDVPGFEALLQRELEDPDGEADVVVVDEIGKMECHSALFVRMMRRLLEGDRPVVATVALRGGGFMAEARRHPRVELIRVSDANRDRLPQVLAAKVTLRLRDR